MKNKQHKKKIIKFVEIFKEILEQSGYGQIITWDGDGKKIKIFDKSKLQLEVLPKHFKHGNYSSFLRQLNLYGFISCKDQDGVLTYENPYFTKKEIKMRKIQKKQQFSIEKQSSDDIFMTEYEDLRKTIIDLKEEQMKIQQKLIQSVQHQQQCHLHCKSIIDVSVFESIKQQLLTIKEIQTRRGTFFIESVKMIVRAMKPETSASFEYLIKCVFPKEYDVVDIQSKEEGVIEQQQYLNSPAPFGKGVIDKIGEYLNHKNEDFNPEALEPVWFCGYSEQDFNFFGFEL
ncbi:unnamed protein product (macronuclear) [Paramecium tetraurelia]|uniref:HSF-type DNA-binding domain-containing protein n=1 Tax=Paramecium tetraurelia TaxID=5888 RepID=A0CLZ8_PARTE|nr:uncharacterized protein GSPATT00008294001 [Paramecium tetraurelia]CAK71815.1 unnamed protein product [Paramecium tetraurelia]|eukprot:XP_001439212.1 hypothetical protein (macronuclear) [Paramecium tetraurelia strain d4-2]